MAAVLLQGTPLKLGKAPATPRTTAAVAQAAADNDAIATITLGTLGKVSAGLNHGMPSVSPTKAHASLRRSSSGVWNAIGAGACRSPVRVLLGLPAEDAETVLQHFQQQVGCWLVEAAARHLTPTAVACCLPEEPGKARQSPWTHMPCGRRGWLQPAP